MHACKHAFCVCALAMRAGLYRLDLSHPGSSALIMVLQALQAELAAAPAAAGGGPEAVLGGGSGGTLALKDIMLAGRPLTAEKLADTVANTGQVGNVAVRQHAALHAMHAVLCTCLPRCWSSVCVHTSHSMLTTLFAAFLIVKHSYTG
jgi:hypothetical protein